MLRIGSKLQGYVHLQIRVASIPTYQRIRPSSTCVPPVTPPECPPEKKKKSIFARIIAPALIIGGGALILAKYNDDFRERLVCYVPFSDKVIKVVFQEERSYQDTLKIWAGCGPDSAMSDEAAKSEARAREEACMAGAMQRSAPLDALAALRDDAVNESNYVKQQYTEMKETLKKHICAMITVTDGSAELLNPDLRAYFAEYYGDILDKYTEAEICARESKERIAEIRAKMRESKYEGARDIVEGYKRTIDDAFKMSNEIHRTLLDERLLRNIVEKAFECLNINRAALLDEITALFPDMNVQEKVTKLRPEEVDLFLVYSALQIDRYRGAIQACEASREAKVLRALKSSPTDVDQEQFYCTVRERVKKEQEEPAKLYTKKLSDLKESCERQVAKKLASQVEIHLASLKEIQAKKEEELRERYFDERERIIRSVREKNAASLLEMTAEYRQLDELFKARTDKDFSAHRSQGLWGAAVAVSKALCQSMPLVPPEKKFAVIKKEIDDLIKASVGGDELVSTVVKSIPPEARGRGIYTQEALINRFDQVTKVALITALVPEEGGPLPLYLLSWIQSWFIRIGSDLTPSSFKATANVTNMKDNTAILREARYWLERGDLLTALRYMNNLKGYSRQISLGWIVEMTKHLETQQAADVIMAHAAARAML